VVAIFANRIRLGEGREEWVMLHIIWMTEFAACEISHLEWALDLSRCCLMRLGSVCVSLSADALSWICKYLGGCFVTWHGDQGYCVGRRRKHSILNPANRYNDPSYIDEAWSALGKWEC
jgi:hypothetical protein